MKITIGHLYPELLNLYGDRGNIQTLRKRLEWRGIDAEVREYSLKDTINFDELDIVFFGGGSDREQLLVCQHLKTIKEKFRRYVESDGVVVAICGAYQLMGHYYKMGDELIEGLGIVDIFTERGKGRLIGNVIVQTDLLDRPIVGFENHGGRTFIRDNKPLGKIIHGHGNNGEDGCEGIVYKNVFGTYLHGPLLPKNPHLCDYVLVRAIARRYGDCHLKDLDDTMENNANEYVVKRFSK